MQDYIKPKMNFEDSGFAYSMSLISGKYKLPILYSLAFFVHLDIMNLKDF